MKKTFYLLSLLILTVTPAMAQLIEAERVAQQVARTSAQTQRAIAQGVLRPYVPPTTSFVVDPAIIATIEQSLSFKPRPIDKARHSIAPSSVTVIGSEKISAFSTTPTNTAQSWKEQQVKTYFSPREREQLRELLTNQPLLENNLSHFRDYLPHQVPTETAIYIETLYNDFLKAIAQAKANVLPRAAAAVFDPAEKRPVPDDLYQLNQLMDSVITQATKLTQFLPNDPYVQAIQEFYTKLYYEFNPLLKTLSKQTKVARTDVRPLVTKEFFLQNPDGSDYTLPTAESLITDPDEELSESEIMMRMKNPPISPQAAQEELKQLLLAIPSNLRIAFINDDMLPRVNVTGWVKKGYLGAGASVDTFTNGNLFLDKLSSAKYDLVITDLLVPGGGKVMMKDLRQADPKVPVLAMSKYDRGEGGTSELYEIGIDGYIWYTSTLNEGAYGYIELLRALKNYYYYRDLGHWIR